MELGWSIEIGMGRKQGDSLNSINSSFIFFFSHSSIPTSERDALPKQIHLCIFHLLFPPIAEGKTEVLIRFSLALSLLVP